MGEAPEFTLTNGVETRTCSVCDHPETRPVTFQSYFYGTWLWKSGGGFDWEEYVISADEIEFYCCCDDGEITYKIEELIWEPRTNEDHAGSITAGFTRGYTIKGTLTAIGDYAPYKYGTTDSGELGETVVIYLYINTDKQSIDPGHWEDTWGYNRAAYKQ